jgi:hypothetical protein
MTRRGWLLVFAWLAAAAATPEALVGKWLLKSQQVGGQDVASRPLTLEVRPVGEGFEFEYSVALNNSRVVSLRFVARLDGSAGDIKDARGQKIGTAKVLRAGAGEYAVNLEGPQRPTASGKMKLSGDGKTLTCESDSIAPGGAKTHTVQVFVRQ